MIAYFTFHAIKEGKVLCYIGHFHESKLYIGRLRTIRYGVYGPCPMAPPCMLSPGKNNMAMISIIELL